MTDAVKLPGRDIVSIEPQLAGAAEMEMFLFSDIGGTDMINLVRHDTISGINVVYSIISDLSSMTMRFDPSLILSNKASYQSIFNQFAIKLPEKIPDDRFYDQNELLPDINLGPNVYFDGENLVIELQNMKVTEFVQVEVETDGKIYSVRENDYQ